MRDEAAGRPRPVTMEPYPAAIVKWRETPRRIVDPCPAPWRDPYPMSIAIRRPISGDVCWNPHGAIFRQRAPPTIPVEIFVTGRLPRHITRRHYTILATVTLCAPAVEVVGARISARLEARNSARSKCRCLARWDRKGFRRRDDIGLAEVHHKAARIAAGIGAYPIAARFPDHHRAARSGNLDPIACRELAHAHVDGPLRESQLNYVIVEIQNVETRLPAHAQRGRADVQLS